MSYVSEIADAMRRVGDVQAQGAANSGALWGGTIRDMGALASQAYQQTQQARIAEQEAEARAQSIAASKQQMTLAGNQDTREQGVFDANTAWTDTQHKLALHDRLVQGMYAIRNAPENEKQGRYAAWRANALATSAGVYKPEDIPAQYPGDAAIDGDVAASMDLKTQYEQAHPKPVEVGTNGLAQQQPDGTFKLVVQPPAKPKSYQQKILLLDGKPAIVSFDPASGTSLDAAGNDVSTRVKPIPAASSMSDPQAVTDVKDAVQGMIDGTNPPMLPSRASKEYTAMLAEAKRRGYDLASAATDWVATQKHIATLNGQQQTRLGQSIGALPELLDSVDALASKWKGGKFPPLNKANLALAKNGAYGDEVASVARQLDSQIADVTADLGNVYMGGNSPTDQALALAGKSLSGDWSEKVLHDMVGLAKSNVTIRRNSIKNFGVQGVGDDNPYAPKPAPAAAPPPAAALPAGRVNPFK